GRDPRSPLRGFGAPWFPTLPLRRAALRGSAPPLGLCEPLPPHDSPASNQQLRNVTLMSLVSRRRVTPAVHGPPERCRIELCVPHIHIRAGDKPCCQAILPEQGRPMQCSLSPLTTQLWRSARVQQSEANILSSEAGSADERSLPLTLLAKVNAGTRIEKRLDKWQLFALLQHAVEQHVRDEVKRMRAHAVAVSPMNECIRP